MHMLLAGILAVAHLAGGGSPIVDTSFAVPSAAALSTGRDTSAVRDSARAFVPARSAMSARLFLDNATLDDSVALRDTAAGDKASVDTTRGSRRPRAIEYSDAYHTRLKIHQIGAYLMIPLFVGEYILGQKLLNSTNRSHALKTAHGFVAAGVGVVFVSNTVTGAWNFWDARKDPNGRARREIHSALMLASDVGFLLTAASAGGAKRSLQQARTHRNLALGSIALSAIGSGMMWLWKN